ncbi:hypothetical protein [Nocardioides campestrisoli]|uniref:hypothetical protein n=1 Tax=Nocardioides campestrisoli TaxID=2736757 RepID=UPI00163D4076|nr:hypothetical protein [Nocardioides campestrisoli]
MISLSRLTGGILERLLGSNLWPLVALATDAVALALILWGLLRPNPGFAWSTAGKLGWSIVLLFAIGSLHPNVLGTSLSVYSLRSMILPLALGLAMSRMEISAAAAKRTIGGILLIATFGLMVGMRQAIWGLTPGETSMLIANGSTYLAHGESRVPGLFTSGQEFSLFAGFIATWTTTRILVQGARGEKFTYIAWAASLAALSLSLQRAPLFACAAAISILLLTKYLRGKAHSRIAVRVTALIAFSTGAFSLLSATQPDRTAAVLKSIGSVTQLSEDDSFQTRSIETVPVALRLILHRPEGYGTGSSGPNASADPTASPLYPHILGGIVADNGYLMFALQIGILGALLCLLFFCFTIRRGGFARSSGPTELVTALVTFLGLVMLLGGYWGLVGAMSTFWILLALSSDLIRPEVPGTVQSTDGLSPRIRSSPHQSRAQ